jgi:hypothetical protein
MRKRVFSVKDLQMAANAGLAEIKSGTAQIRKSFFMGLSSQTGRVRNARVMLRS